MGKVECRRKEWAGNLAVQIEKRTSRLAYQGQGGKGASSAEPRLTTVPRQGGDRSSKVKRRTTSLPTNGSEKPGKTHCGLRKMVGGEAGEGKRKATGRDCWTCSSAQKDLSDRGGGNVPLTREGGAEGKAGSATSVTGKKRSLFSKNLGKYCYLQPTRRGLFKRI